MGRNRIFMNDPPRPKDRFSRDLLDHFDLMAGVMPLDGTNLEYIYRRESMPKVKGEPELTKDRGRNLKGNGVSYQCRTGRHKDCYALRCECTECAHDGTQPAASKEAA